MSCLAIAQRWPLVFVAGFVFVSSTTRSQTPGRIEVKTHLGPAAEEVLHEKFEDESTRKRTLQAIEDAFVFGSGPWNREEAASRVVEVLSREGLALSRDQLRFEIVPLQLGDPKPQFQLETSLAVIDAVSSVMRRHSVLEEIGPTASRLIDPAQLQDYLKETVNVPDYQEVADSFDPALAIEAVTFEKPTTLLRIYGGTSNAVGRYYFCCLWTADTASGARRWSDVTGLATPPGNLLTHLAAVTIPAGTTAIVGTVADNFRDRLGHALRGGNTQIFIPHVRDFPFQEYRLAGGRSVSGIALESADRLLWFQQ
jgi:hypothetical protein